MLKKLKIKFKKKNNFLTSFRFFTHSSSLVTEFTNAPKHFFSADKHN